MKAANRTMGVVSYSSARRTVVDDARRSHGNAAHNATGRDLVGAAVHLPTVKEGEACFRQSGRRGCIRSVRLRAIRESIC